MGTHGPPSRCPALIIDRALEVGSEQTGHNSGVIHSGLYYRPGSLKARLTRIGRLQLMRFCEREHIPFELSGKLVIAVRAEEMPALRHVFQNGLENSVPGLRMVGPDEIQDIEPHAAGIQAIHSPQTGIVDYVRVSKRLAERVQQAGHTLILGKAVAKIDQRDGAHLYTDDGTRYSAKQAIVAAGIYSDHLARQSDMDSPARMIPFRGDYLVLKAGKRDLVRSMIYPVPNPALPFLGVHFTRRIADGSVWVGPNAVLHGSRSRYRRSALDPRDVMASMGFLGFWRMARRHWRSAPGEWLRDH